MSPAGNQETTTMTVLYNPANENLHSLASLTTLPTPAPQGPRHHIYPFADYANAVARALPQAGLNVTGAEFAVSKDAQRMFGVFEVESDRTDLRWQVGVRGAHDQSIARGLVLGERIMVCSNLCFSGQIQLKTKQTTNIEHRIGGMIIDAVEQAPGFFADEAEMIERLQNHAVRDSVAHAALAEVYRRGGLSAAQLGKAIDEWHAPSFDHETGTLWTIEQACTQALKPGGSNVNHDLVADRSRVARATIVDLFKLAD